MVDKVHGGGCDPPQVSKLSSCDYRMSSPIEVVRLNMNVVAPE